MIVYSFMYFCNFYINEVIYWLIIMCVIDINSKIFKDIIVIYWVMNFGVELDIIKLFFSIFYCSKWIVNRVINEMEIFRNFSDSIIMVY